MRHVASLQGCRLEARALVTIFESSVLFSLQNFFSGLLSSLPFLRMFQDDNIPPIYISTKTFFDKNDTPSNVTKIANEMYKKRPDEPICQQKDSLYSVLQCLFEATT